MTIPESYLYFLPWLRRGLAKHITSAADVPNMPANVTVRPYVTANGTRTEKAAKIQGPAAVSGIQRSAIVRRDPPPGTPDFEPNYFPAVELSAPDLPWLFTPQAAGPDERLRPWFVLIVIKLQEGVTLSEQPGAPLPVLRIDSPAVPSTELIDLADSWSFAHVQADDGNQATLATAVQGGEDAVRARVICPRALEPNQNYIACLVPAFDAGRKVGLGGEHTASTLDFAWDMSTVDNGPVELPVYDSWTFATSDEGDFETLARRLVPRSEPESLGVRDMDVSTPGGEITDASGPVIVSFEGALKDPDAPTQAWDAAHQNAFVPELETWMAQGDGRLALPTMPQTEPVVTPPLYGGWQASASSLPSSTDGGWLRELNVDVVLRAAAGLGAEVVRRNQEALMAAAWNHAGEVRAAMVALNQKRLQLEVGRALTKRVAQLNDGTLLQVSRPMHAFVPSANGTTTLAKRLAESHIPNGILSHTFLSKTRPANAAGRSWRRRPGYQSAIISQATDAMVRATNPSEPASVRDVLRFASAPVPSGTFLSNAPGGGGGSASIDVSSAMTAVRQALDPKRWVREAVDATLPGIASLLPADEVPTRIPIGTQTTEPVGPRFQNALFWDLKNIDVDLVMPGVGEVPDNTVRLLQVNDAFVTALLAGANHEMSRELLWREYPAMLNATYFHHFWESLGTDPADGSNPEMVPDIASIHSWNLSEPLANVGSARDGGSVAFLIKGELLRRFPNVAVYAVPKASSSPDGYDYTAKVFPSFFGTVDVDTRFFGFDLALSDVRSSDTDEGYYFVLEEPMSNPRFGFEGPVASFSFNPTGNAASVAVAHYQTPFRVLRHADGLV
ncbi:MAG: hypothetical protein AAGA48_36190 [Myxococcota bacterium]